MWRIGTLVLCWWECKTRQPLWKTVRRFLKKFKNRMPCRPAIPRLGVYLQEPKAGTRTDIRSLRRYSQGPEGRNNVSVPWWMNGHSEWGLYIQRSINKP